MGERMLIVRANRKHEADIVTTGCGDREKETVYKWSCKNSERVGMKVNSYKNFHRQRSSTVHCRRQDQHMISTNFLALINLLKKYVTSKISKIV